MALSGAMCSASLAYFLWLKMFLDYSGQNEPAWLKPSGWAILVVLDPCMIPLVFIDHPPLWAVLITFPASGLLWGLVILRRCRKDA